VREFQGEGNNTTSAAVTISPAVAPNLVVSDLIMPERVVRGQAFEITYTVTKRP
jgi:large repetitive protein